MNVLIDTNILLPLEPATQKDLEPKTQSTTELFRLATKAGYRLFFHPDIHLDLERDKDKERAKLRRILLAKYEELTDPPRIKNGDPIEFQGAVHGSNDWVDDHLLFSVFKDAVDFLVTDDEEIHKKASKLGIQERVKRSLEFLAELKDLYDVTPEPPPAVISCKAHSLDEKDPIFESLRNDYPGFDKWLSDVKRQQRDCYIIEGFEKELAGLCIIKPEVKNEFGFPGNVLKLCTFKIAEKYFGNRYGELLLKPVFDFLKENDYDMAYVTVLEKYPELVSYLEGFGFTDSGYRTKLNEKVLEKRCKFSKSEKENLDPLEFNRLYGPWVTKFGANQAFVIPIKPEFHKLLFPELVYPEFETQKEMSLLLQRPCGNSIKKAYLSNAKIRRIQKGDNVFFYRSGDIQSITALGIVEDTKVSDNPELLTTYVGDRTVYRYVEISRMCERPVLAIRFRRVKFFYPSLSYTALKENEVLNGPPQSILKIEGRGVEWLKTIAET